MSKKTSPLKPKLSDQDFEALKAKINTAIHELVFACHHAEEDELESACDSLMTAQGTLEEAAAMVNGKYEEQVESQKARR